ncbi:patatin-like phospholipase family protein [Candidatus Uabimicrobium amorphum]|nr:patatin-like phospholipase family protein [Candidatus Uabimicrobium amorphum]
MMRKIKRPFAVVLPGGGFRGAYQAGVVSELGRLGIEIDIVATASVGTCNGAALVLDMWEMLPDLWERAVDMKIFQPSLLLKGKNPFAISGVLEKFAHEYGRPGQFDQVATDFLVSVTNATNMTNEVIDFKSTEWDFQELQRLYLASSCIPYICDRIEIRGHWYIDGGFTNNCPINYALERGAKEIWVVNMGKHAALEKTFFGLVKHSLKVLPKRKFRPLQLLDYMVTEQQLITPNGITIQHIAPSTPLELGHLRLTRDRVKSAIALGKQDIAKLLSGIS